MLNLPGVTLCCIDTANHGLALRALERSRAGIAFARTLLLTDGLPAGVVAPAGIEVVSIPRLDSRDAYSRFVLKSLLPHVGTAHVLLVQWDGYVVDPAAWDPAFLDCDYIGAKWYWHTDGMRVGNGGFSLRSRRLLEALRDPRIVLAEAEAEDEAICRTFRPLLEREYGIRFATEALADRFSFEAAYPIGRPFGFHGLFNFCRTVPPADIAAMAPEFPDAVARSPQLHQLLRNCAALGQWEAAAAIARRILALDPSHAEAAALLATAERGAAQFPAVGRNEPCPCGSGRKYKQCHGALGGVPPAAPPDPDALVRTAMVAHQSGDLAAAERGYRAALAAAPAHPHAMHYVGVLHYQRNQLDAALPLLDQSAAAVPEEPEFHNNLGLALAAADRGDEAIAAYRRALALKPDHPTAWNNLGLALQAANRLPEAIAAFRKALERTPDFPQAHWNLALALLARGEFAEGWREYDWRLAIAEFAGEYRPLAVPRWDGVARPGQSLLLTCEQGLGDAIQFVRFAAPLAARGLRIVVRAPRPLARLLATAPGVAGVAGSDDPPPACDAHLPLLSTAGVLDIDAASIPAAVPYLAADPQRRAAVARALATRPERLKVGLAWAGNPRHANDLRRSVPLAALTPLFAVDAVAWYSLQKGDAGAQVATVAAARRLTPLPPDNDLDDTAALIAELDLVVSVDTSVAHLAGALGRPVWILLPFAPDWRWQLGGSASPWYPTARLYRQPRRGDWDAVARDVADALARLAAARDDGSRC
jgi:tetratricopeptide (TPR) repeat protein